ncbi:hypothetical protein B0H14DRAFT_2586666 [Mycena olivaceomarginata]|nr:hypothetical protein B0H14DRAFT_2586666 [Mycena olivaceomarginata]
MHHKPNLPEYFRAQGREDDTMTGVPGSGGQSHPVELQRTHKGRPQDPRPNPASQYCRASMSGNVRRPCRYHWRIFEKILVKPVGSQAHLQIRAAITCKQKQSYQQINDGNSQKGKLGYRLGRLVACFGGPAKRRVRTSLEILEKSQKVNPKSLSCRLIIFDSLPIIPN